MAAPGIEGPEDLKGKKVAVVEGGLAQIYVAMWLEKNGHPFDSVEYVNIIADDAFAAMIGEMLPLLSSGNPMAQTF